MCYTRVTLYSITDMCMALFGCYNPDPDVGIMFHGDEAPHAEYK